MPALANFDYRNMSMLPDVNSILGVNNIDSLLDDEEDDSSEEQDDSADEETGRKRKRARKATGSRPRAKRSDQNGNGLDLAIRPAKSSRAAKPRAKKTARFSSAANAGGLYCKCDIPSAAG